MILYANGCSHTAAAEAVIPAAFAEDDGRHGIDRRPHPVNLAASWCSHVAAKIGKRLICKAESGSSNSRILRTTREWITNNPIIAKNTLFIIQWTTWEREEWLHQGVYYQVNASGIDWVPDELRARYKNFVVSVDWNQKTLQAHDQIWQLHQELLTKKIRHLFFSGHSTFSDINPEDKKNWGKHYLHPYDSNQSYHNWLLNNGGSYANPQSYHFNAKSHRLWADHVLQYLDRNRILEPNHEISSD